MMLKGTDGLLGPGHGIADALVRLVEAARSGGDVEAAASDVEAAVLSAVRGAAAGPAGTAGTATALPSAQEPARVVGIPMPASDPTRTREFP